jgi:hypothetical protein
MYCKDLLLNSKSLVLQVVGKYLFSLGFILYTILYTKIGVGIQRMQIQFFTQD